MKIYFNAFTLLLSLLAGGQVYAAAANQADTAAGENIFTISNPDFDLSPHTGMTKKHWEDAALYLLEGAFSYINELDDAMVFPKQPGKSYPRDGVHTATEKLEGLCRTLFVAAPLLKKDPNLEINGIKVADYYRHQILRLIDPTSDTYIAPRPSDGGPSQKLVEFGALSISLFVAPEMLWEPLSKAQQDALAATMISYGDGPTVPSNWKFFNIYVLSFFKSQGYEVNEELLEEYLTKSLEHYRGDGWYNDNPAYDYYSMWAFQMYGVLWSDFFGKEHYPAYAKQFEKNFRDLKGNYPYMFSRDGEMIMWGRSISYRFGSVVPFPLMGMVDGMDVNFGWMRRIASGTLLQFLQHPDFLKDRVPTLGFYGAFEPAVQRYSTRGSAYWAGKIFLALLVPDDNPFWTAKENEGAWEQELGKGKVYNNFQEGAEILITNYPNIGAAEVRAWCNVKVIDNWEAFRGSENYNRLAYNSEFPWQADGENGQVAMNYVIKNAKGEWEALRLFDFKTFKDGIYYRDVVLETDENIRLQLADIPLANGILRVDRNISTVATDFRLGHYALPQLDGPIKKESRKVKGHDVQIISNGRYQLALVSLNGWDSVETLDTIDLHPASKHSAVINVSDKFKPENKKRTLYTTLMLWKNANEKWTDDELVPVKKIKISKNGDSVTIAFTDGSRKVVRYE